MFFHCHSFLIDTLNLVCQHISIWFKELNYFFYKITDGKD